MDLWSYDPDEDAWTRIEGGSVAENAEGAERLAVRRLEGLTGLTLDLAPEPISLAWVRS